MKTTINISIDDVCPHPKMGLKSVDLINKLIEKYPNIKCSLFVPTCMTRYKYREKSYYLPDYPDFVNDLKSLPPENFEICYHGHFHGNANTNSNNDEFRYTNKMDAFSILQKSQKCFNDLGLRVSPVFRPPGFWLSKDSFSACKEFGIKVLALNSKKHCMSCYGGAEKSFGNVIYIGKQMDRPKFIELLFHAGRDQKDFLGNKMFKELKNKLNRWKPLFSFLGDINGTNG